MNPIDPRRTQESEMAPPQARSGLVFALAGSLVAAGCASPPPVPGSSGAPAAREDIFVLRSERTERLARTTACPPERTGFTPAAGGFLFEDHYTMWAVAIDDGGRISNPRSKAVGSLRACFAQAAEPRRVHFYAEARIAGLPLVGQGQCVLLQADFPEPGISPARCHLNLRDLPAPYVGGLLTTNSVNSRQAIGDASDPVGYVQPSIATIRLWRPPATPTTEGKSP